MHETIERKQYHNKNFQKKLTEGKKFEIEILGYLKRIFDPKYYIIENNFDTNEGHFNLFELQNKLYNWEKYYKNLYICYRNLLPKNSTKEEIIKHLKNIRGHDIVIKDKLTNKIKYLIEAKDFAQMIYYPETGLPRYYLYKLGNIKKIFEELSGEKIKQYLIFKDNKILEEKRKKLGIKHPVIKENNKFVPYGFELTDDLLRNTKVKTNKYGKIIPSNFPIQNFSTNNNKKAKEQLLWSVKIMQKIDCDLFFPNQINMENH